MFLKYSTLIVGDNMAKEIDMMPFRVWQQQKQEEIYRNKILQERQEKISRAKIRKSLKRLVIAGSFSLALGSSLVANAKNAIGDLRHNIEVNAAFQSISDDARDIVYQNTNHIQNENTGNIASQYNHYGIAKDVENYASMFGNLTGDAILAAVLEVSEDNAYQNDDRIVNALSDDFTKATTADEYVHSLGFETKEEYLEAMKESVYNEAQRQQVIQKYAGTESELKR